MNPYAIAPLVATIAYLPLLFTTAITKPWRKRHTYFVIFLFSAMAWSFVDFIWRGYSNAQNAVLLSKIIMILFTLTAVQSHVFVSSFYPPQKSRWLLFAYGSLAITIGLVLAGFIPDSVKFDNGEIFYNYGPWILVVVALLLTLVVRNLYIFINMLKTNDEPITRNQTLTLIISIFVFSIFSLTSVFPIDRKIPVIHYGNLINAFILSYAVIRHQLVDIKLVLRRGTAWVILGLIGTLTFWALFIFLQSVFHFQLDITASLIGTAIAVLTSILVYSLKGQFFELINRAFRGSSYDYIQRLKDFTSRIHNIFSLKEQGGELLWLLTKAINVKQACLLFPEAGSGDYFTQFVEPKDKEGRLANLRLRAGNPVIRYMEKERKTLTRENLAILPAFLGLWPREKEDIESKEISMFVPLISRDRLTAIMVLGNKHSGRYTLEDIGIIEDVTSRVAVSIEKEYLREQLHEREAELSVINNSSNILSSSLDIQEIFPSFIEELKKVIDIEWASTVLLDENDLVCVALSSTKGSAYQVGERIPLEESGTGWVINQRKVFIESDLSEGRYFKTGENFYERGLRTVVYLPLIAKGSAIGSLIITSKKANAYNARQIKILEQLSAQIAMPLENTLLYAKAEQKARIDELTGLLNRRSLDEMIDNEISRHSRYGGVFSLAILDLDSFKIFNDTLGHPAGDKLLRLVGTIIKNAIRTADRAFRYGGDEFAILLPQTTIDAGIQVTERVRRSIAENTKTFDVPVTISIGLASWPDDGISHTDIIAAADVTLYRAKRSGGNQSCQASGALANLNMDALRKDNENGIDVKTLDVIRALAETLDTRSYYTFNHSKRVTDYSLALGKALKLDSPEMCRLEACALLHDIGKICISDLVINKATELTPEEWELVKSHPKFGSEIAARIPQLTCCTDGILYHHERFDGTGYPSGLKGDKIPLEARILAIADSYVAMTSERSYSGTMNHKHALEELQKGAGTQFDPYLIEQFVMIDKIGFKDESNTARR